VPPDGKQQVYHQSQKMHQWGISTILELALLDVLNIYFIGHQMNHMNDGMHNIVVNTIITAEVVEFVLYRLKKYMLFIR